MLPVWWACVFEAAAAIKHAVSKATLSRFLFDIRNSLFDIVIVTSVGSPSNLARQRRSSYRVNSVDRTT
jgi:hypothetical protein